MLEYSRVGPRQRPSAPVPLSHFGPQARKLALGVPDAIQRAPEIANDALSGGVGSVIVAGAGRRGRRTQEEAPAGRCWAQSEMGQQVQFPAVKRHQRDAPPLPAAMDGCVDRPCVD